MTTISDEQLEKLSLKLESAISAKLNATANRIMADVEALQTKIEKLQNRNVQGRGHTVHYEASIDEIPEEPRRAIRMKRLRDVPLEACVRHDVTPEVYDNAKAWSEYVRAVKSVPSFAEGEKEE
jgi:hypothetical protein